MKRIPIIVIAVAAGLAGSTAAMAESFDADTEDTGMSWKAVNNEIYNQQRSPYVYPGGRIPGTAYSAPGLVYGGGPVQHFDYAPAAPAYVPFPPATYPAYPPAPPGY
jgi:hypothetical protein